MTPLFELWLYPETIAALALGGPNGLLPGIYLACRDESKIPVSLNNMTLFLGSNEIHVHTASYRPFP